MFRTDLVVVLLDPVSRQFRKISKHFRAVSPLRRAASSVQASCSIHDVLLRFWNVWRFITDLEKEQAKKTSWKENKSQRNSVRVIPTCEHVWPYHIWRTLHTWRSYRDDTSMKTENARRTKKRMGGMSSNTISAFSRFAYLLNESLSQMYSRLPETIRIVWNRIRLPGKADTQGVRDKNRWNSVDIVQWN